MNSVKGSGQGPEPSDGGSASYSMEYEYTMVTVRSGWAGAAHGVRARPTNLGKLT